MRIRRFTAPDSKAALAMVKAELGEDAVILANRTVNAGREQGGPGGRGKTYVEVVAAMDYDLYSLQEESGPGVDHPLGHGGRGMAAPVVKSAVFPVQNATPSRPRPVPADVAAQAAFTVPHPDPRRRPDPVEVVRWRERLVRQLKAKPLAFSEGRLSPRIVAMVGATGVGKTTTAAKLAAWCGVHLGKRVALVSMDCYRIGATDQLRTYARIMRMPCEISLRKTDLQRTLAAYADYDLVIIDTAGKSPYDKSHIAELMDWFQVDDRIESYLTFSATTKKEDLAAVVDSYRAMPLAGLVVTKLDETRAYASLCQQIVAAELPVCCLGTGQRVPEDFVPASSESLEILFGQGWTAFSEMLKKGRAGGGWVAQA